MDERGFARAQALFRRNLEDPDRPAQFTLLDREWDLLAGVFAPIYTPVTEIFSSWIPYPEGATFLEMGSGAGVTAVIAALSGCREVTALDICAAAVENTRRNARRHGVAERVRALQSDLFGALDAAERFDMIFWNSDFVEAPGDFVQETDLHHAFFDPAYRTHREFLRQGPRHLAEGGRLLLGFSDLGNWTLLRSLCSEAGLEVVMLESEERTTEITIEFQLLELRATTPGSGVTR